MPKITKIVNGEYIGGEKYTITDAGEGKSTILFTPDTVIKDGTPVGAEILNEMQKNGVYSLNGTRIISGQKEIYTCNIEGIVDFGLFDIVLIMTPNATNTTQNVVIDLSGTEFQIISYVGSIAIGELSLNVPYIFKLNISAKKAFLIGSEKLNRGTYPGTASDLKTDIDRKVSKSGDTMTGTLVSKSTTLEETSSTIYNEGFVDLRRKNGNPLVRFFNQSGSGQVGRLMPEDCVTLHNEKGGGFYRIYDNNTHEFLIPSETGGVVIDGQNFSRSTVLTLKSSNSVYSGVFRFYNTIYDTDKRISAIPSDNVTFAFNNAKSTEYPSKFRFTNNTGYGLEVDVLDLYKFSYSTIGNYRRHKDSTGMITLFFEVNLAANQVTTISFPEAFPTECHYIFASGKASTGANGKVVTPGVVPIDRKTFSIKNMYTDSNLTFMIMAVGV